MKINILNKGYIALAILLVAGTIYKIIAYKTWARYDYYSAICTPQSYPIYLQACYFITADADDLAWINDEKVNDFRSEWGDEGFPEARDPLRLPEKLVLKYAAYSEQKFYSDTLSLPVDVIQKVFKEAAKKNQLDELFKSGQNVKGLKFLVGVVPDGQVVVWLRGRFLEQVILKAKIAPKEPRSDEMYFEKPLSKSAYLNTVFEGLSDSLKTKIKSGWDQHANYLDTPTHYIDQNKDGWKSIH